MYLYTCERKRTRVVPGPDQPDQTVLVSYAIPYDRNHTHDTLMISGDQSDTHETITPTILVPSIPDSSMTPDSGDTTKQIDCKLSEHTRNVTELACRNPGTNEIAERARADDGKQRETIEETIEHDRSSDPGTSSRSYYQVLTESKSAEQNLYRSASHLHTCKYKQKRERELEKSRALQEVIDMLGGESDSDDSDDSEDQLQNDADLYDDEDIEKKDI